jgi:hypothetical protein
MTPRTTTELRLQAMDCKNPRAAAILVSVANWLDGKQTTEGNLQPHEFADLWTTNQCVDGCRIRKIVDEFINNTTPNY